MAAAGGRRGMRMQVSDAAMITDDDAATSSSRTGTNEQALTGVSPDAMSAAYLRGAEREAGKGQKESKDAR